jgi:hypothetical protein
MQAEVAIATAGPGLKYQAAMSVTHCSWPA